MIKSRECFILPTEAGEDRAAIAPRDRVQGIQLDSSCRSIEGLERTSEGVEGIALVLPSDGHTGFDVHDVSEDREGILDAAAIEVGDAEVAERICVPRRRENAAERLEVLIELARPVRVRIVADDPLEVAVLARAQACGAINLPDVLGDELSARQFIHGIIPTCRIVRQLALAENLSANEPDTSPGVLVRAGQ